VSVPANSILRTPALRAPAARAIGHRVFRRAVVLALFFGRLAGAQIDTSSVAPHRYLVLYRNATIPGDAESRVASAGAHLTQRNEHFGIAAVESTVREDDASNPAPPRRPAQRRLRPPRPHRLRPSPAPSEHHASLHRRQHSRAIPQPVHPHRQTPNPRHHPHHLAQYSSPSPATATTALRHLLHQHPQGWAVQQVGGYGNNVPGGPAHGPWDTTMGKGVRIAIIDSGVDQTHPDIAPNLALNLTEVDQSAYPSPCDDGTPQDQQGHGTWTASLAAAAIGPGTGQIIGVAPAATILNIKVLQRMPATIAGTTTPAQQCTAGEASGLLSWVMKGIEDAIANRADVISLSIGATADLTTGDGAGLLAAFNRITYAATQANIVLVASAGNDGFDLSNPRYVELPAQSRGVLAVVASTNPACAQNVTPGAACAPGPVTLAYYSNYGTPLNAVAAPGGSYPAGDDLGISGWVRGACSTGKPNTLDGLPADSAHSYGCFKPWPYRLRSGHGHQRLRPSRRRCRRSAPRRPPQLDRHRNRVRHAQLSRRHPRPARPPGQRHDSPNSNPLSAIRELPAVRLENPTNPQSTQSRAGTLLPTP